MGQINHDAIIVTVFGNEMLAKTHAFAKKLFFDEEHPDKTTVSEPVGTGMNGYMTFIIAPDGSKEGWEMSDKYDKKREEYIEFLKTLYFSDGSSFIDWAWVKYGEYGRRVFKSNCKNLY